MSRESQKAVTEWITWYNEHMAYANRATADPVKMMQFTMKMVQGLLSICVEQERAIIALEQRPDSGSIILPKGVFSNERR